MLHAAAERGELRDGGLALVGESFEKLGETAFVRRDGDSLVEGVHYHASVGYALEWQLALLLAKAEVQFIGQPVPSRLRVTGGASRAQFNMLSRRVVTAVEQAGAAVDQVVTTARWIIASAGRRSRWPSR